MPRPKRTDQTGCDAVLYPAIAEVARRVGASAVGLIDVGRQAGINLRVDRVGITYSNGQFLGDRSSAVQATASIVGRGPVPPQAMPGVVARLALDRDPAEALSAAITSVPADALPVVITTWALSQYSREKRLNLVRRLEAEGTQRPIAWVSAEGVGVAPTIPTLGDRPASGHSIIGLAVFDGSQRRVEAAGRCWSRGRMLSWLAGSSWPDQTHQTDQT